MTHALRLAASAIALSLSLGAGAAMAAKTSVTVGMVLEPPILDPTAGAGAADP